MTINYLFLVIIWKFVSFVNCMVVQIKRLNYSSFKSVKSYRNRGNVSLDIHQAAKNTILEDTSTVSLVVINNC